MEIEYKVEGAVIKADIHRGLFSPSSAPGPGRILTITGGDATGKAYRAAAALNENWQADEDAVLAAKGRYRSNPLFADVLANIETSARGNVSIERWMLLDYRMLGEPFMAYVERVELVGGREEWRLTNGNGYAGDVRRILTTGVWVPDQSIYDEMEDMARALASGSIDPIDAGGFLVRTTAGRVRHFTDKQHAMHWLFRYAKPWLEDYSPAQQSSAMARAAWFKAKDALDRVNAIINGETYVATASLIGSGGYRLDLQTEGLIGMEAANEAMHLLIEQLNPTAYPMPRMH